MFEIVIARPADLTPALRGACEALLTADELATVAGRVFERNRREQLVTRVLCRTVLGRALGVAPAGLRFRQNEYGRPELDPAGRLHFNLTNTVELVAIAITDFGPVGVDAESLARGDSVLEVAPQVFTDRERAALDRLDVAVRRTRAVELWCMKEAYMKALGMGFSCPPHTFEVNLAATEPLLVGAPANAWTLALHRFDDHVLATCRGRGSEPPTLRCMAVGELL